MTTSTEQRPCAGLLRAMDDEWPGIVGGGVGRRAWRRWAPQLREAGLDLAGLDELVAVIRHPGDHRRTDVAVRMLIGAAQAGDDLAARVIMQGLVPFVGRLAGVYARYTDADRDDIVAEILTAVHLRIIRTPLEKRDRMLVWYLQLTVRRQLTRGDSRRLLRTKSELCIENDRLDGDLDTLRAAVGGVRLNPSGRRSTADHVVAIVTSGVRAGDLTVDDARLLLLVAAGNSAAAIARTLQRDRSVISRRLQRATRLAGRAAA